MDHVVAALTRIRSLHSRIALGAPAPGFGDSLDRALATTTPPAGGGTRTSTGLGPDQPRGITLAQMLGRPLVGATLAAPPPPAAGPVGGALRLPVHARTTSGFGLRVHPVTGEERLHSGIDLAAPTGTPIAAAAAGTVTFAGPRGGYGNLVIVDHGDGTETRYAHQDSLAVVVGQVVAAGEVVGTVGSTGRSTGPHLHFEVRRHGEPVDPAHLLAPSEGAVRWTG